MPDIFMHFIFKRWLSSKKSSPKPGTVQPGQPAAPVPPKQP